MSNIDAHCDALTALVRDPKDDSKIAEAVVALARCALRDLNRLADAAETIARKLGE